MPTTTYPPSALAIATNGTARSLGTDAARFALEPLALGQADELLDRLVGRQGKHTIDVTWMHVNDCNIISVLAVGE